MTIAIIDYKAGNCTSVLNAFASLGVETVVTREADVKQALSGKPFLGICLGMQILFEHSEEDGGVNLLNILPGKVKRFPDTPGFKIPEIGWNQVNGDIDYYFVHSYYAEIGPYTTGRTEYAGVTFTSAVRKGNLFAYQFHPEKSGKAGLALLKEFATC